jgi:RNA polymerase sigma factor (TIGR02999 family)
MKSQTPAPDSRQLALMVERAEAGDTVAKDILFASLYSELHRLAQSHLRRSGSHVTMGTTTLLHEAYLDLNGRSNIAFPDRLHFLKYASRAMRGLIVDYVRTKRAQKRGGEITFIAIADEEIEDPASAASLETLSHALDELAQLDAALAELVDLKFFCGFSFQEIAIMRGVSDRTVQRDWAKARVLLHDALQSVPDAGEEGGTADVERARR